MKPVNQTIIDGTRGDCLRACYASLLELPIEEIPNFAAIDDYGDPSSSAPCPAQRWLRERGLAEFYIDLRFMLDHAGDAAVQALSSILCSLGTDGPTHCILSMPSQKFADKTHAVVGRINGFDHPQGWYEIAHDPNPQNDPYNLAAQGPLGFSVIVHTSYQNERAKE